MNFIELQVGVIGNLVHSSPNIKKEVILAGALQPVIGLLRYILTLPHGKLLCTSLPFSRVSSLWLICIAIITQSSFFLSNNFPLYILLKKMSFY